MAAKNPNPNDASNDASGETAKQYSTIKLVSVNGIRRAGIRFPAGEPVEVDLSALTKEQMAALENERDLRPVR